jgi:hypothetical protein
MAHTRQHGLVRLCAVAGLVVALSALGAAQASATTLLLENFDNVANLVPSGWAIVNNSAPAGTTDWFQGNPGVFTAQSGAANSYAAANFEAAGFGGNISDWLISPTLTFHNTDVISFWARTEAGSAFPDRLELRLSLNGSSTNVGATDASVGDFSTLLLSINPGVAPGGFPENWALFQATISGLGGATDDEGDDIDDTNSFRQCRRPDYVRARPQLEPAGWQRYGH